VHLLLTTGFLGSGKTTFIIRYANHLISAGKKVAILVNEIGEIGIDDQLMKQLDLNVWEMMGGCICCTLSGNMVEALQQIDADYNVDLVILEPSGAAEPGNILIALPYYKGKPLESIRSIALLDPLRITELYQILTPLITKQIENSDKMVLTKADLANDQELEAAEKIARELNPEGQLFIISQDAHLPIELFEGYLQ
jgi:G3E family GTPase